MGQFYQWNRLAIKFSREPKIALLQISWRTESESGYVWTWKFLNPQRKICGLKNIRIRLDGGERYDRIAISIKFENVTRATMARKFAKKVRCTFRVFFLFIGQTCYIYFFYFHVIFAVIVVARAPKVSSTVNCLFIFFCFINARFVGFLVEVFSGPSRCFPFSALTLFPGLFTVPLTRMTDLLSRLKIF